MLTNTPYTLAIDGLSVMVAQPTSTPYDYTINLQAPSNLIESGATRLVLVHNNGRSFYRYAYEIFINDSCFGTLHTQSLKSESPLMKITINNEVLYTDWLSLFIQFQSDFNLKFNNITKLDIACDSNKDLILWFLNYFEQPELYAYRVNQQTRDSIRTFATEYQNGAVNKALYPYKVEGKALKLYNKSREIADNHNQKQYISDYHEANGLDTAQDVFRAEISLGNSVLKTQMTVYQKSNGIETISKHLFNELNETEKLGYIPMTQTKEAVDLYRLLDSDYLASIFNKFAGSIVEFRLLDNDRLTRCTRIPLLELTNPKTLIPLVRLALPGKHEQRTQLHTLKYLVQQRYLLGIPALLISAQELAAATGLTERLALFVELYRPKPLNRVPVKTSNPLTPWDDQDDQQLFAAA